MTAEEEPDWNGVEPGSSQSFSRAGVKTAAQHHFFRSSDLFRNLTENATKDLYFFRDSVPCRAVVSRLPRSAPAWLDRLSAWLEPFEVCFTHVAQRGAFRRYLLGLLSDSRRKSMSAMLERVRDPGTYQAFQHFITDAPWSAETVWQHLRATIPDRTGVLILDGTSFPKQGPHSVGVARQYRGALGKIANCQTAVTVALWTGAQAWMLGAALYLPESWLTPAQRTRARIPASVRGQPKWQLALTLLRQVRASGITVTAVLGDAEFGESATLRRTLHRAQLPYALGVSSTLTVFVGTPALVAPAPRAGLGRPRSRRTLAPDVSALEARAWAAAQPARAWRVVSWRNGTHPVWRARFCATRVTPAHDWRDRRSHPRSGSSANAPSARAIGPSTIWSTCRPPRRCAPWSD